MLQEDRFLKIIEYLKIHNVATFGELSNITGASVGTIRRDLAKMEENGMLSVVRGGAAYHKDDLTKQIFDMRGIENREDKQQAAKLVSEVVTDGQAIALNSGTTNIEVARFLAEHYHRLTVLTNNLYVLDVLKQNEGFRLIVPGGILRNEEHAIFGKQCENEIREYNLDVALLAVNAISLEKGITDFRTEEVGIICAMMDAARNKVIVTDHTKFERVSYMNVCRLEDIDYILTDNHLDEEKLSDYRRQNVKVITPGVETDEINAR